MAAHSSGGDDERIDATPGPTALEPIAGRANQPAHLPSTDIARVTPVSEGPVPWTPDDDQAVWYRDAEIDALAQRLGVPQFDPEVELAITRGLQRVEHRFLDRVEDRLREVNLHDPEQVHLVIRAVEAEEARQVYKRTVAFVLAALGISASIGAVVPELLHLIDGGEVNLLGFWLKVTVVFFCAVIIYITFDPRPVTTLTRSRR